eukprot:7474498-Alexandrium_andersonii.AAC.1
MARARSPAFGVRAPSSSACSASHSAAPPIAFLSGSGPKMGFPRQIMPQPSLASAGIFARMRPATPARPKPFQRS